MFNLKKIFAPILVGATMLVPTFTSATTYDECAGFSLYTDGDGTVINQGAGAFDCSFTILGSNTGTDTTKVTTFTSSGDTGVWVTGEWDYSTQDTDGSSFDLFGYMIGANEYQLSTNGQAAPAKQEGTFAFYVQPFTVFGWYITATDDLLGKASAQVYANFAVPLPAGGLLLLSALGGLGLARRRRSAEPAIA